MSRIKKDTPTDIARLEFWLLSSDPEIVGNALEAVAFLFERQSIINGGQGLRPHGFESINLTDSLFDAILAVLTRVYLNPQTQPGNRARILWTLSKVKNFKSLLTFLYLLNARPLDHLGIFQAAVVLDGQCDLFKRRPWLRPLLEQAFAKIVAFSHGEERTEEVLARIKARLHDAA